mgnify:CR=1 FL=1
MEFDQIKTAVKTHKLEALRQEEHNYLEAVLFNKDIDALKETIKGFLGEPVFPSPQRLSSGIQKAIKDFGGVMPGQTLYFTDGNARAVFAMFWPWQDKQRTTLKLAEVPFEK